MNSVSSSRIWNVARVVLVLYLLLVLMLMIFERWLVYPIPPVDRGDWHPAGLVYEDVQFQSADGTKLHGWFVPNPNAKRAILYFHGNGEQVGDLADLMAHLRDALQASVFMFDYRGYGHSEGRPDEAGCIADGLAAQKWLTNKTGLRPDQIVLMGRSLGGGVAVAVAAEKGAQALVLENSFPSVVDVAAIHYPWVPVRWLMDNRYDSLSRIQRYHGPVFQIHGTNDGLVPIAFAQKLFEASPSREKRFLEMTGRGHNDSWPASYYRELAKFLDQPASEANAATEATK
jgi:fermentation-respiration switch protein FrsA (DUF1100 family)